MSDNDYVHQGCAKLFEELDRQIVQEAILLDPGVIERVLQNDKLVCSTENPRAFEKLRSLAMIQLAAGQGGSGARPAGDDAHLWERLRAYRGDCLGSPAA